MKVYNRVVLNIDTWEILDEDSFDYSGPIALAWDGSGDPDSDRGGAPGGGPGGGSSGGRGGGGGGGGEGGRSRGTGGKRAGADSAGVVGDETSDDGGWSGAGNGLGGNDSSFGDLMGLHSKYLSNPLRASWNQMKLLGGPIGMAKSVYNNISDYNRARDKTIASMRARNPGLTDAQIDAMEKGYLGSLGLGGLPDGGVAGTNAEGPAGTLGATDNEFAKLMDEAAAAANPALGDQFKGLFEGVDAPYDIRDLMQDFTGGVKKASDDYSQQNRDLAGMWDRFSQDFDNHYGRMSGQYDDLNADYDANTRDYSAIYGQQQGLGTKYDELLKGYYQKASSIPQLNLKLPGGMGGGGFSLAPKNWNNIYTQQATTAKDILSGKGQALTDQRGTIDSRLANTNSKKSAYDSKAEMLQPWAQARSTGLINRGVTDQNQLNSKIAALKEQFTPFQTGYDIYDRDKQIAAGMNLQQQRLDAEAGNSWDRWAPVAAAAMPAVIDIGKEVGGKALDLLSDFF